MIEGYVVATGREWLLLAALDPAIRLDGHIALRLVDVAGLRRPTSARFVGAALRLRGQWPPAAPVSPVDLEHVGSVLASLGGGGSLVTVHPEVDEPEHCYIGIIERLGQRWLWLREVSPRAVWLSAPTRHRLNRITRIDTGGLYEQALRDVAGSPPQSAK
jgi:hypothetical protein